MLAVLFAAEHVHFLAHGFIHFYQRRLHYGNGVT